jgi:hypothetical protein
MHAGWNTWEILLRLACESAVIDIISTMLERCTIKTVLIIILFKSLSYFSV